MERSTSQVRWQACQLVVCSMETPCAPIHGWPAGWLYEVCTGSTNADRIERLCRQRSPTCQPLGPAVVDAVAIEQAQVQPACCASLLSCPVADASELPPGCHSYGMQLCTQPHKGLPHCSICSHTVELFQAQTFRRHPSTCALGTLVCSKCRAGCRGLLSMLP